MVWVIGLIVLILLIVSAWFRKVAVSVIIVTGVVGSLIYVLNEREEERALSRISLAELDFENVALKPSYSGYKLSGRIKNNSQEFTLKQVNLLIIMQDCTGTPDSQDCVTIGESHENMDLNIPPGQARDFEKSLYFPGGNLKLLGKLEWNYSVSGIKGE
ncbi:MULTISPECIES: hypothetical protein [Nitrosomonas]|uniref:Uncharacterized protein n=1 Tax=Nitrosomonas europaea (strain ATCC 19718 / CIP 103999 / KCTC 2705 / NBRC 14298) TaxID=228410 RepID=Q82V99_NITEU|nr:MULTISPECIES: hypothetical protein [Nitrosomonas]MBV6390055.1 hypothetical protein [Nitrosomonas europaea]MEB2331844.1 hypothetical protein [Nitrosomonas sp.]CAD85110.1 hypothetical protein NE1199 [Nitrosomonas europaea ATCC 19718]SDW38973.1 hypothetical protein SAMN05216310_11225 [Nitrosomonas europaea]SET02646.1 hypothetical protein SAMN05216309_11425 [Nitrosomonas europaea]